MGWTLGGAVTGWLLAAYGFEANMDQTEESLKGIRLMITLYPAAGALISALLLTFYKLNDGYMDKIIRELAEKRTES